MAVCGEKIRLIRRAFGWEQKEFADKLGIPQPHLSEMESGMRAVPEHVGTRLPFLTGFPYQYFNRPIRSNVPAGSELLYRKTRQKWRKSESDQAYCQLVFDTFEPLTQQLAPRTVRFPALHGLDPKEAAAHLRNSLGFRPDGRVENLTYMAEVAGVRVVGVNRTRLLVSATWEAEEVGDNFQAFSFWHRELPVVFIRTDLDPDVMNWALGHDLVHLIMHKQFSGEIKRAEAEAQEAAEEFFMPEKQFREELPRKLSVETVMRLASRWNVSPISIIIRADKLGLMPSKAYFIKCLSGRKPSISITKPRFYRQMCEVLFGMPVVQNTAGATLMPKAFVKDVMLAHAGDDSILE